jgi:uncharacterized alkaline shock family protein YloU
VCLKKDATPVQNALEVAVEAAAAHTKGIRSVAGCEVQVIPSEEAADRGVTVRLKMVVEYGSNIPEIGKRVTGEVRRVLFRIFGLSVAEIVLEVEGVHLPE